MKNNVTNEDYKRLYDVFIKVHNKEIDDEEGNRSVNVILKDFFDQAPETYRKNIYFPYSLNFPIRNLLPCTFDKFKEHICRYYIVDTMKEVNGILQSNVSYMLSEKYEILDYIIDNLLKKEKEKVKIKIDEIYNLLKDVEEIKSIPTSDNQIISRMIYKLLPSEKTFCIW